MVRFNIVWASYKETWDFISKNFRFVFDQLLKINFVAIIAAFIAVIIGLLVMWAAFGSEAFSSSSDIFDRGILTLAIFGIVLIIFLIGGIAAEVIESVSYNVVDKAFTRKQVSISSQFSRNLVPIIKYNIFELILILPFLAILLYFTFMSSEPQIYGRVIGNMINAVAFVIEFLFQFVLFEMLIIRTGLISGIKTSLKLIKNNFIEAIAFSILYGIVAVAVAIPAFIVIVVLVVLGMGFFIPLIMLQNWILIAIAGLVAFLVLIAMLVLVRTVQYTLLLPALYLFWKKLKTRAK